jgi:SP family galactose:H+ symporter-like MFS transporter
MVVRRKWVALVWKSDSQELAVSAKDVSNVQVTQYSSVYFMVGVAALGGLLFGYDTAVISGALFFLRVSFALTPFTEGITVSAVLFGAMIGSLLGGKLSDLWGRRRILLLTALVFIGGSLLTALTRTLLPFIACRILVGFSIGVIACVVPIYISEMAPARLRGMLVTCNQLALTIGIALSYWIELAVMNANLGWPLFFMISTIPALLLFVGMLFNVETPRWLASKGRWDEVGQVLSQLVDHVQAEQERSQIRASLAFSRRGRMRDLLGSGARMALLVASGLAIFQQLVGINTVIYYAPIIFHYAGFASAASAILASGAVGLVNVLATIIASLVIDRVGRRPLLLGGTACMVVMLSLLGAIFALGPAQAGYLTLAALLAYIAAFALSMGPIFWLVSVEVFPNRLRAAGSSIATFCNWSANLVVSLTFLSLLDLLGKAWTFWLYALLGLLALLFCWRLVPETRQKSLEQIEQYWQNDRRWVG